MYICWNWTTIQQNKTREEHFIHLSQDKSTLRLRYPVDNNIYTIFLYLTFFISSCRWKFSFDIPFCSVNLFFNNIRYLYLQQICLVLLSFGKFPTNQYLRSLNTCLPRKTIELCIYITVNTICVRGILVY